MQSKITFNRIRKVFKTTALALGFLSLFTGLANAQTYENGPLSTGATSSNGSAAPAGTTWSEVQNPNTNAGFGANISAGLTVADNFSICGSWNISKITFYAYSTGFTGTTSPFNDVRIKIYNTDPSVGSPAAIFGDLTTNRFLASSFTNIYRIFNGSPATNRKIWAVEANVNTTLPTGNYWIEWQLGNGGLSNFSPAVTITGASTQAGWNAKQNTLPNTWVNLVDGAPATAQDMPFKIDYTTAACAGTPAPGNTLASAAAVCPGGAVALSLQNCTPGSGVTYQWQSGTTATGPWTNIAGATNSTYGVNLTATTFYQAIVTCGGNSGTSTPVQVSLNPPNVCYCVPPATDCSLDDEILNVKLGSLNNSSTGCSGAAFSDYTSSVAPATDVFIGVANPMTVTVGPGGNESVGVWIDYNQSGGWEANEFTLLGSAPSGAITGAITVPSTVAPGTYRMRVRVKWGAPALTGAQACAAFTFGETEDYRVTIAPCVTSSVTTQPPATKTISCSGTGTITATIAGSLNQYQWQVLTSATGAVWTDLTNNATYSGVTTNTLTITNALPTLNNNQYRVRYQGACTSPSVTSASKLTVGGLVPTVSNALPINRCISDAPTAISIATPVGLAALSTTASGTLHTMIPDNNNQNTGQNTNMLSNTLNVNGIPAGATITGFNVKLNITHAWIGDMIIVLKAPDGETISLDYALTGTGGLSSSANGFVNTIISSTGTKLLSAGANPYSEVFALDNAGPSAPGFTPTGPAGFDPTTTTMADMYQGNGAWTLAMYDYYGDLTTSNYLENWELNISYLAPPSGEFTPTTGLFTDAAGTIAYTGGQINTVYANPATSTTYSATVNTAVCGSGTVSIPVTVGSPITGSSTVANITGCVNGNVTFSSTQPSGGMNTTYQWQDSTSQHTWQNISGATSATYTITGVTAAMTGNKYRLVRTVAACSSTLTSSAGTLTVVPTPVLTVSASPSTSIYPGQTTTLSVASSTTVPAAGYQWYLNGVPVAGATGNTLVVDVDGLGDYTVTATDANACGNAITPSIAITATENDRLFVYPSPSTGIFTVRYFSEFGPTAYPRVVNLYDMKGSKVYSKSFSINSPYTKLEVDASILGNGIYQVELIDLHGNRIKTGRVLIKK